MRSLRFAPVAYAKLSSLMRGMKNEYSIPQKKAAGDTYDLVIIAQFESYLELESFFPCSTCSIIGINSCASSSALISACMINWFNS